MTHRLKVRSALSPAILFAAGLLPFAAASPVAAQTQPVAFTGATVIPVSGAPIPNGTVIIEGGRIKAVGAKVPIPANARRIDARGKFILPGLIDAQSSLFMSAEELTAAGAADRDVLTGADLYDDTAEKVLARGVTTVYVSPGSRGAITGTGAVVKLRRSLDQTADVPGYARVMKPTAALKATLGVSAGSQSTSLGRLASYEALRSAFLAAQQYAESFERYARAMKVYEARAKQPAAEEPDPFSDDPFGGFAAPAAPQKPTKPRKVPAQEIMAKALRREIPVRIEAHRADDILNALRLADEFKLRVILESGTEAHQLARELARRNVPVIWGPALLPPGQDVDTLEHWPGGAGKLSASGIKLAVATAGGTGLESRFVLENAAAAAGNGLNKDAALRAITLGAAELLGVADRVGSIAPGKDADLVILSASPWDARVRIEQVWVDGEAVRK